MREYVKTLNGLHIYFEALEEHIPACQAFSFKETGVNHGKLIKAIEAGEHEYFMAKVSAVDPETGKEINAEYLGCCVYTPARSFIIESGYFDQMAEEVTQ